MSWYLIFNLVEFQATELVSQKISLFLTGLGLTEFLVTQGNSTNVLVDGMFLPVQFNDQNPYVKDGYGVFVDVDDNVWIGITPEDDA